MNGINAGDLDRQIVIQTSTPSRDPVTNQAIDDWDEGDPVWAQWLERSSTEVWRARQIEASIEGIYRIYDRNPRPTPESTQIIGHDGRTYDVKSVTEIGRGEGLDVAVAARGEAP